MDEPFAVKYPALVALAAGRLTMMNPVEWPKARDELRGLLTEVHALQSVAVSLVMERDISSAENARATLSELVRLRTP